MEKNYQTLLYYGIEECESECAIFHSFRAVDPKLPHDDDVIAADLAEQLDCEPDDDRFQCKNMYIDLPESLIRRIQQDAIANFVANGAKYICENQAMLAGEIHRIVQNQCHMEDIEFKLSECVITEWTEEESEKISRLTSEDVKKITMLFDGILSKNDGYYEAFWASAEAAIRDYLSQMD